MALKMSAMEHFFIIPSWCQQKVSLVTTTLISENCMVYAFCDLGPLHPLQSLNNTCGEVLFLLQLQPSNLAKHITYDIGKYFTRSRFKVSRKIWFSKNSRKLCHLKSQLNVLNVWSELWKSYHLKSTLESWKCINSGFPK